MEDDDSVLPSVVHFIYFNLYPSKTEGGEAEVNAFTNIHSLAIQEVCNYS